MTNKEGNSKGRSERYCSDCFRLLENFFAIRALGSSLRQELVAGFTTFLAMAYSTVVVPDILGSVGFDRESIFIATCLTSACGSLLMGLWAKLPIAIGCGISLSAFVAFSLVGERHVAIPVLLGVVFIMGVLFTVLTQTGIRQWLLRHIPTGIAHGTGIGIGLLLLLIATSRVGLVVQNPGANLPLKLGHFATFPVLLTLGGLAAIIGLARRRVASCMLFVVMGSSLLGLLFDPEVTFQGWLELPKIKGVNDATLFGNLNIIGALSPTLLPSVLVLVLTAIFDAAGTLRAIAGQANLLNSEGQIINGDKALAANSISTLLASLLGGPPAAIYIESATGIAAGGRSGLTAVVVGVLFLFMLFLSPISYLVPNYATAPPLMYVGLLMLGGVKRLDFEDGVDALSGLVCAVFTLLSCNLVTGIMVGLSTFVAGRLLAGELSKLRMGTIIIALLLLTFYISGLAI